MGAKIHKVLIVVTQTAEAQTSLKGNSGVFKPGQISDACNRFVIVPLNSLRREL